MSCVQFSDSRDSYVQLNALSATNRDTAAPLFIISYPKEHTIILFIYFFFHNFLVYFHKNPRKLKIYFLKLKIIATIVKIVYLQITFSRSKIHRQNYLHVKLKN